MSSLLQQPYIKAIGYNLRNISSEGIATRDQLQARLYHIATLRRNLDMLEKLITLEIVGAK